MCQKGHKTRARSAPSSQYVARLQSSNIPPINLYSPSDMDLTTGTRWWWTGMLDWRVINEGKRCVDHSFLGIRTTADIVGLSLVSSSTHRSTIWMHLKASSGLYMTPSMTNQPSPMFYLLSITPKPVWYTALSYQELPIQVTVTIRALHGRFESNKHCFCF